MLVRVIAHLKFYGQSHDVAAMDHKREVLSVHSRPWTCVDYYYANDDNL